MTADSAIIPFCIYWIMIVATSLFIVATSSIIVATNQLSPNSHVEHYLLVIR